MSEWLQRAKQAQLKGNRLKQNKYMEHISQRHLLFLYHTTQSGFYHKSTFEAIAQENYSIMNERFDFPKRDITLPFNLPKYV